MADELDLGLRIHSHIKQQPMLRVAANPYRIGSASSRMVAAFVRMGGESSPWGVAWKLGRRRTEFRFAPEPRNRAAVQEMLIDFANALDGHFEDGELDLPQLFLPGATHVEMIHFLAIRHTRGTIGDERMLPVLQRMGRRCYELFEATRNRNRTHCLDMTAVLRRLYAFPCEPAREAHLGYLVSWLEPGNKSLAAREAERLTVSTSIDPRVEGEMEKPVAAYGAGDPHAAKLIGAMLEKELARRIDLTIRAIEAATDAADENPGVDSLVEASRGDIARFSEREATRRPGDIGGGAGMTGHAMGDAANFAGFEADQIAAQRALVPHDHLLQTQLIESGSGVEGSVQEIVRVAKGRTHRIQIDLACPDETLVRFRVGDKLVGTTPPATNTEWQVEAIDQDAGHRRIRLISSKALAMDQAPRNGSEGVRFCSLEDPSLKLRLLSKIREASSDDPDDQTLGQWILEGVQGRRDAADPPAAEELDLTGAAQKEDRDAEV